MTKIQADLIRQFRMEGLGYKAIATKTGLTRDIVRNFCKSNKLEGYGPATKRNVKEQIYSGDACRHCGKEISQPMTGRSRKFCSEQCRRNWWKANPEAKNRKETAIYHRTCIRCGKVFVSYGNKKRKYCCHDCYIKARFWEGIEDGVSKD